MKKIIWSLVAVIVLGGLWWFTTRNKIVESMKEPIKIGAVLGLTGPAQNWAEFSKRGIELGVEDVNLSGGINGRPLEVVYEDGKSDPKTDVSAFLKLVQFDHINIVVGDVWSYMTNPLIPIADSNKTFLISPTTMDKSVYGSSPYFYTMGHTIVSQERAFNKFFDVNPDVKTVSILCWDDTWGQSNLDLWKQIISQRNLKIVSQDCTSDYSNDYRTEIAKIKAKNPDVIITGVSSGTINVAFQRLSEFGIKSKILGQSTLEEAVKVNKLDKSLLKNVWFVNWDSSKEFVDKFQKRFGVGPYIEAQNSYETIRSIAIALKANADVLTGLKTVKYQSVDGYIDFTQKDNISVNKAEAKLFKVSENGDFIEVTK